MQNNTDPATCFYGARLLLTHLQTMMDAGAGVLISTDMEYIHQMRVASRRLRNALNIFSPCFLEKSIDKWLKVARRITRELGAARDLDVQIDTVKEFTASGLEKKYFPGLQRLHLRLSQSREKLQSSVLRCVHDFQENPVAGQMRSEFEVFLQKQGPSFLSTFPMMDYSYRSINRRLVDLLLMEQDVYCPDNPNALHAIRISAKWLRYTLELFSSLYPDNLQDSIRSAKKIQESLGVLHDCDVWIAWLPAFLSEEKSFSLSYYGNSRQFNRLLPGIQLFLESRQTLRATAYHTFSSGWENWKHELVRLTPPVMEI